MARAERSPTSAGTRGKAQPRPASSPLLNQREAQLGEPAEDGAGGPLGGPLVWAQAAQRGGAAPRGDQQPASRPRCHAGPRSPLAIS